MGTIIINMYIMSILSDKKTLYYNVYKKAQFTNFPSELENESSNYTDMCSEKVFSLLPHQVFLSHYLNPHSPIRNLLIAHGTGLGKTCSAVSIAEAHLNSKLGAGRRKIIIITGASILSEFKKNLHSILNVENWDNKRNQCVNGKYINYKLNDDYKKKEKSVKALLNSYYEFYTYDKLVNLIQRMGEENITNRFSNSVIIVDEVHNMREYEELDKKMGGAEAELKDIATEEGGGDDTLSNVKNQLRRYDTMVKILKLSKNNKLVLLSATPMIDDVEEIVSIINLFRYNLKLPPIDGSKFYKNDKMTKGDVKIIQNLFTDVSQLSNTYSPKMPKSDFRVIPCRMSDPHMEKWEEFLEHGNKKMNSYRRNVSTLPLNSQNIPKITNLETTPSMKYTKLYLNIKKQIDGGVNGLIFIKVHYKSTITDLKEMFNALMGFQNYTDLNQGDSYHRFAIIQGDVSEKKRDEIVDIFNRSDNWDGRHIKILIGTDTMKEGVSLSNVESIHIMEPWFNMNKIEQIKGRGIRLCRHIDFYRNTKKSIVVKVNLYISTYGDSCIKENIDDHKSYGDYVDKMSYDEYTFNIARTKQVKINQIEKLIQKLSVDGKLNSSYNKNSNNFVKLKKIDHQLVDVDRYGTTYLEYLIRMARSNMEELIVKNEVLTRKDVYVKMSNNNEIMKQVYGRNDAEKKKYLEKAIDHALYRADYNPRLHNLEMYAPFVRNGREGYLTRRKDGVYIFVEKYFGDSGIGGLGKITGGTYKPIDISNIEVLEEKKMAVELEDRRRKTKVVKTRKKKKKVVVEQDENIKDHIYKIPNTSYILILRQNSELYIRDSTKGRGGGQICKTYPGKLKYEIMENLDIENKLDADDERKNWKQYFKPNKSVKNNRAICDLIMEVAFGTGGSEKLIYRRIGSDPKNIYDLVMEKNEYYIVDQDQPTRKHRAEKITKASKNANKITFERIFIDSFGIQPATVRKILKRRSDDIVANVLVPLFKNPNNLKEILSTTNNNVEEKKQENDEVKTSHTPIGKMLNRNHFNPTTPEYILETITKIPLQFNNRGTISIYTPKGKGNGYSIKQCKSNVKAVLQSIITGLKIEVRIKSTVPNLCKLICEELKRWLK